MFDSTGRPTIPEPAVYVPMSAEPWAWGTLVVRKRATGHCD